MASSHHSLYVVLVVAHVVTALVGFGAVALSGVYAGFARHPERPGVAEETSRYFASRAVADWALPAVPVLGLGAQGAGGDGLGRAWVAIALVLWVVAMVAVLAVARPARREVRAGLSSLQPVVAGAGAGAGGGAGAVTPDPEGPGGPGLSLRRAATRLAWAAGVVDVVFVVALLDMVYKPG